MSHRAPMNSISYLSLYPPFPDLTFAVSVEYFVCLLWLLDNNIDKGAVHNGSNLNWRAFWKVMIWTSHCHLKEDTERLGHRKSRQIRAWFIVEGGSKDRADINLHLVALITCPSSFKLPQSGHNIFQMENKFFQISFSLFQTYFCRLNCIRDTLL